jgi:uncharacterized protein YggE
MKTALPAALVLIALAAPLTAQPAPPTPPLVTVQGRGEVRVPNTVALVQLGFEAAGPEEAPVREDVSRRSQAVTAALKEQKAGKLQTTAANVFPQLSHSQPDAGKKPQPPRITGYTAQVAVTFEAPVEDAGRIISAMMGLGANSTSILGTQPTDEVRRDAENQALVLAAKDAERQARALLGALNLAWRGFRSLDATGGRYEPRPVMARAMTMAAEAAPLPELDIQGGETVVSREVVAQVEFQAAP